MKASLLLGSRRKPERPWYGAAWAWIEPILDGWQGAPKSSLYALREWIGMGYNLGLRTGMASGVAVIDIDKPGPTDYQLFPRTLSVLTGSGGLHLYYSVDRPVKNSVQDTSLRRSSGLPRCLITAPSTWSPYSAPPA